MSRKFQPLLSAKVFSKDKETTEKHLGMLKFPAECSVKWDGWRMFEYNGEVLCRSMDPPKNKFVQKVMREFFADLKATTGLVGVDGEMIGGNNPMARNAMQLSTSAFNTHDSEPEWVYQVFDTYQFTGRPFTERLKILQDAVEKMRANWPWLHYTHHQTVTNMEDLMAMLATVEADGGEGVMGRDPNGIYKLGRSTMRDGILWALKPYADGECRILSLHEMMSNQNEATINSLGNTQRSGHKENMVPKGTFGYAICEGLDPVWPETFRIGMGPGLNDKLRAHIWANPEEYVNGVLKYKYQAIGCVDRPRQPKWMGLRGKADLLK